MCTAMMVTDVDGIAYYGRTMEMPFETPVPSSLTYIPRGTQVSSLTPSGTQGLSFNTSYSIIGMTLSAIPDAILPLVVDGMNDQGLGFSANAMMPSAAAPVGSNPAKILSGNDFGTWILGNHQTVNEVKAALSSESVQVWLPPMPILGNVPMPLHYSVFDKAGNGLVIEFVNNKLNVYDNPVGVLTNGPEFPWHLQNLNNYTFTNVDQNSGQLGKLKLKTVDAGIALSGLPSAQTSTGRFVKGAFYVNYVQKGKTPEDAVNLLSHIMNNFDRPQNLTMDEAGSGGETGQSTCSSSEVTQWSVMGDLSRQHYYVRSINAMNWSVIDMGQQKGSTRIKTVSTYAVNHVGATAFI